MELENMLMNNSILPFIVVATERKCINSSLFVCVRECLKISRGVATSTDGGRPYSAFTYFETL